MVKSFGVFSFCLALFAAAFVPTSAQSNTAVLAPRSGQSNTVVLAPQPAPMVLRNPSFREMYLALPPQNVNEATLGIQAAVQLTVPFWSGSIVSPIDGKTYKYHMVGTSPFTTATTTQLLYQFIGFRFKFSDGTVLDSTLPACGDSKSVLQRVVGSPIFAGNIDYISNGQNVGTTQYEDAFQRANFWAAVKGKAYHVLLKSGGSGTLFVVSVPKADGSTHSGAPGCPRLGLVSLSWFDPLYKAALTKFFNKPGQVAIGVDYNTVFTMGSSCCVIGYHSAYGLTGGTQAYSISAYADPGIFSSSNTGTLSHEIGELFDDPFVTDPTPAWGHIGQVPGCQANLEVGDPLTGTEFHVTDNGFTYELQELAFFSWFYRQKPSIGTGGLYSLGGTFTHGAGAICH